MSSNREAIDCDGIVMCGTRQAGPLRLPMENADQFIADFNGRYEKVGMSVQAKKKSPATSDDVAGDGWSVDSVGTVDVPSLSNLSGGV